MKEEVIDLKNGLQEIKTAITNAEQEQDWDCFDRLLVTIDNFFTLIDDMEQKEQLDDRRKPKLIACLKEIYELLHEAVKAKANICTIVKKYQRSKFFNLLNYEKPKKSLWKSVNFFKNKSDLPVAQEAVFADMATAILKTETIVHVPISSEQTFISALKLIFDINADKLEHDKNCAGLYQQLSLIEAEIKDLKENPLLHYSIMEDRLAKYLEGMYMAVAAETKNTVSSSSYNFYITIKKHFLNYLPVLPEKNLLSQIWEKNPALLAHCFN